MAGGGGGGGGPKIAATDGPGGPYMAPCLVRPDHLPRGPFTASVYILLVKT